MQDLADISYLLSPQDLMALEQLPAMVAAGVGCFKIEGRLKGPEYVAATTAAYRAGGWVGQAVTGSPYSALLFAKHCCGNNRNGTCSSGVSVSGLFDSLFAEQGQTWMLLYHNSTAVLAYAAAFVLSAADCGPWHGSSLVCALRCS